LRRYPSLQFNQTIHLRLNFNDPTGPVLSMTIHPLLVQSI
jgi:hypothetical protein